MRVAWSFSIPGDPREVGDRAVQSLVRRGAWSEVDSGPEGTTLRRGARRRRHFSFRVEAWPTTLRLRSESDGSGTTVLGLAYDVATGLHFVGAVEEAVLEAEVALLREDLLGRPVPSLATAARGVRRPVGIAVVLNVCIALVAVTLIAVLVRMPWPWGLLLAIGVALVDAITIAAFADLLAEGFRRIPRLTDDRPLSTSATGSRPEGSGTEGPGSLPRPDSAAADRPAR